MVDSSGSMVTNDPMNCRHVAAKYYIDHLASPDRVAVLDFDAACRWTGPDHHLDSAGHDGNPDYEDPKADLEAIDSNGGTSILCALQFAEQEYLSRGDPARLQNESWIGILLTDGYDTAGGDIRSQAAQMGGEGIHVYTIGLIGGQSQVDVALLMAIADLTQGRYFQAETAFDLVGVFKNITTTLGQMTLFAPDDGNATWNSSATPMIVEVLPPYIVVDPDSYRLGPANSAETSPWPDCSPAPACRSGGTLPWRVSTLSLGEVWSVSFDVRCALEGTHPVELVPDSRVSYRRASYAHPNASVITTPFPAQDITCVDTVAPPVTPPRNVTSTWDGNFVIGLEWEIPDPVPDHYLIYRVTGDPRGFTDLGVSSPLIVARPRGDASSWTESNQITAPVEYYYLMRAANATDQDVSVTSNTAGVFVGALRPGLNAVARPLEYFPWTDATDPFAFDTLGEYAYWFRTSGIESLDSLGRWQPGGPDERFDLGKAYLLTMAGEALFVFTGLPGTMILHDDAPFKGFRASSEARSLNASVAGEDVVLTFDQPPGMGGGTYELWRATTRTGFFNGSAALAASIPAPGAPTVTVADPGVLLLGDEFYYLVIPVNDTGVRGASTYSVGLWETVYSTYDTFALPLRADVTHMASWYAAALPGLRGFLWISPDGVWIPHFAEMGAGAYDIPVVLSVGLQIAIAAPVRFVHVGW